MEDAPQPTVDPDRWTSTVVLGDGDTAVIRPIRPDDADELARFHEAQSPDSRYRRFFSPKPTLSTSELARFTTVDMADRAALVLELHGEFVAWASYERWQDRNDADVAFMVDDAHQGKGIATLLLEHLAAIATHNGLTGFTAQTLADNRAMLAVFAKAGWPVHRRFDSGVIDIDFPLAETAEFIDSVERREQRADSRAMARLLLPSSIAVIGASDEPGSVGAELWRNASARPRCPVYPVNPNHDTIGGVRAYRSIRDVPGEVGLALIAVPAAALPATIDECIDQRVRGAVVVTATDGSGIDVDALVHRARRNGLRIVGPASMGIASPRRRVEIQAALVEVTLPAGRVAISMQSGTLGSSLLRLASDLHLGLSWFVSLGDKRDVSANDLLQFWEDDEATSVVALYTESLGNPRKFARIAQRVSRRRPIVVVRAGAALLDTTSAALYEHAGVIEVPTVTALLDTARVLADQPLMTGSAVRVISNARSPETLASATLRTGGLTVVDDHAPLHWAATPDDYAHELRRALDDPDVDAVLVIHAPPVVGAVGGPVDAIAAASRQATKPIVTVMLGRTDGPLEPGSPIPNFAFPEQAVAALARLHAYSAWRERSADEIDEPLGHIDRAAARALVEAHAESGSMPPDALRSLLASYAVAMPHTEFVAADDAVEAADRVGYPVAVKAERRRRGTSAEAGVALDLQDASDVAAAVATMRTHLGGDAERVHVQAMAPPGLNVRIHAETDERIGPFVTTGLGGIDADVIGDETRRLAPFSPSAARSMVAATKAGSALDDDGLDAVADILSRVAQLVSDHPEITELDLNPVLVGSGVTNVVDASIRLLHDRRTKPHVRRLE